MPKVSIIVPVHNTEKYLQACIDSLTAQSLGDIEIILVENCSTDNSLALCHEIAKSDSRIKVLSIDKADLSTARNEGIKVASGEYCGFVDSDDTILPGMFKDMYEVASQHDLGLVCVNLHKVFDDRADKYLYPEDGAIRLLSAKDMTILNLTDKSPAYVCTHLFKRSLFDTLSTLFRSPRISTTRIAPRHSALQRHAARVLSSTSPTIVTTVVKAASADRSVGSNSATLPLQIFADWSLSTIRDSSAQRRCLW